jgi:hypothetical protein
LHIQPYVFSQVKDHLEVYIALYVYDTTADIAAWSMMAMTDGAREYVTEYSRGPHVTDLVTALELCNKLINLNLRDTRINRQQLQVKSR